MSILTGGKNAGAGEGTGANYRSDDTLHSQPTAKKSAKVEYKKDPAQADDAFLMQSIPAEKSRKVSAVAAARQEANKRRDVNTVLGRSRAASLVESTDVETGEK